jgi:hypothetical protein
MGKPRGSPILFCHTIETSGFVRFRFMDNAHGTSQISTVVASRNHQVSY